MIKEEVHRREEKMERKNCPSCERQYGLRENNLGLGRAGFGSSVDSYMTWKCSQLSHQLNWSNNLEAINQGCNEV